jgi:hypothetical protein
MQVPDKNNRAEYYPFGKMKINLSFFIPNSEERKDAFRHYLRQYPRPINAISIPVNSLPGVMRRTV